MTDTREQASNCRIRRENYSRTFLRWVCLCGDHEDVSTALEHRQRSALTPYCIIKGKNPEWMNTVYRYFVSYGISWWNRSLSIGTVRNVTRPGNHNCLSCDTTEPTRTQSHSSTVIKLEVCYTTHDEQMAPLCWSFLRNTLMVWTKKGYIARWINNKTKVATRDIMILCISATVWILQITFAKSNKICSPK